MSIADPLACACSGCSAPQFAHAQQYRFLFFLDSDILLQGCTLRLCYEARRACVGSVYTTRWAQHCVVAVAHQLQCEGDVDGERDGGASVAKPVSSDALMPVDDDGNGETPEISPAEALHLASQECAVQLLLDPQFLQPPPHSPPQAAAPSYPCVLLGFGALMVHRSLLHVPYRLAESIGGVCGEDVGFCIALLRLHQQRLERAARRRSKSNNACPDSDSESDSDSDFEFPAGIDDDEGSWLDADLRPHFLASHSVDHLAGGRGLTVRPPAAQAGAGQPCTTFVPLVSRDAVAAALAVGAAHAPPATQPAPVPPCAMLTRIRSSQIFCLEQHVLVPWRCVAPPALPRTPPPRGSSHNGHSEGDGFPVQLSALERLERSWTGERFYTHLSRPLLDGSDSEAESPGSLLPPPVLLQPLWHFPASAARPLVSIDAALATASAAAQRKGRDYV